MDDHIHEQIHNNRMHAIALAAIRFVQLRTEYDELDLAAESPDICGSGDLHLVTDSDFDDAVAWLDSISNASPPPPPPGYEDF